MARAITLSVLPLVALFFCGSVRADITVGPFTFDDLAFADDATQIDDGTILSVVGGVTGSTNDERLDDALTGSSPTKGVVGTGQSGHGNLFQLDFTDLKAVNATGPDIVFFDARFSADPYEIAVRPVGSSFTTFVRYEELDFIDTGEDGPTSSGGTISDLFALPIELDDFGLAACTVVDAIQFRALENSLGTIDGDPVMAAVLNGTPETIVVDIDIRPGDDTNSVNLASSGLIPVAILSSAEFDATQVDPETVCLAGSGVAVRGKGNKLLAQIVDANGDGLNDLVMKVETQNLDPGQFQNGSVVLTGSTFGGQAFKGSDTIFIVPPEGS